LALVEEGEQLVEEFFKLFRATLLVAKRYFRGARNSSESLVVEFTSLLCRAGRVLVR